MQLRAGGEGVGKNKQRGTEEEVNEGKEERDREENVSGAARIRWVMSVPEAIMMLSPQKENDKIR